MHNNNVTTTTIIHVCSTSSSNHHKNDVVTNYIFTVVTTQLVHLLGKATQPYDIAGVPATQASCVTTSKMAATVACSGLMEQNSLPEETIPIASLCCAQRIKCGLQSCWLLLWALAFTQAQCPGVPEPFLLLQLPVKAEGITLGKSFAQVQRSGVTGYRNRM